MTEKKTPPDIHVTDANAVRFLDIKFDHGPGVYRIRGENGAGKSEFVRNVGYALAANDKAPQVRRGATTGRIQIGDAINLKIGKRVTGGRAPVVGIDANGAIDQLIAPGLKGDEPADKARANAFLDLNGAKPDESLFAKLPDWDKIKLAAGTSATLVDLAAAVKSAYHEAKRVAEADAAQENSNHQAALTAAGDVTAEEVIPSQEELTTALAIALREKARLDAETGAAEKSRKAAEEARKKLDAIPAGRSVEDARSLLQSANLRLSASQRELETLNEQLAQLNVRIAEVKRLRDARSVEVEAESESVANARSSAELRAACERQIATGQTQGPTADQLEHATAMIHEARYNIETAAVSRRAQEQLTAAADFAEAAKVHAAKAAEYLSAAAQCDVILSEQVGKLGQSLRWKDGRLIYIAPNGDEDFFGSLSWGQRAKIVLDMLVKVRGAAGEAPLVILSQETWEALDVARQDELEAEAKAAGVYIVGPECTRDRAEIGQPIRVVKPERKT